MNKKNIIFLFSMPRSGSTLLQKLLMADKHIKSIAEPWLLLPLLYLRNPKGVLSEYSHSTMIKAIDDLNENLNTVNDSLNHHIKKFVGGIYDSLCNKGEHYFLDKTPRYFYIIKEISEIFPDAKFIFLVRNPLGVYSSVLKTWCKNRYSRFYRERNDLLIGPNKLASGYTLLKKKSVLIQYENLVINPHKELEKVFKYLNIEYDENVLYNYCVQSLGGRMGDQVGINKYKNISDESLYKWVKNLNTPFRRYLALKYLDTIDESFYYQFGYNKKNIHKMVKSEGMDYLKHCLDPVDYLINRIIYQFQLELYLRKKNNWVKNVYLQ